VGLDAHHTIFIVIQKIGYKMEENQPRCEYCLERMKLLFKDFESETGNESKYTSMVFSLGFVTLISFFSYIHKYMELETILLTIILLIISISMFILNEIYKMRMGITRRKHESNLWKLHYQNPNEMNLDKLEINKNQNIIKQFELYNKFYPWSFWPSLVTGILAGLVLLIFSCKLFLIRFF
jgi:hypothetical protein